MNNDQNRIVHMLEHIRRIQTMMQGISEVQFYHSIPLQDGTAFNFAILGEAANKVSSAVQDKHPEIPWGNIIGMRNILIHDYEKSDPQYMWEAIQKDLPVLLLQLEKIFQEF